MRTFLYLALALCMAGGAQAQKQKHSHRQNTVQAQTEVDEQAVFPGGDVAMLEYFGRHIAYPQEAVKAGKYGTIYLEFMVDARGGITKIKVLKGLDDVLDANVIKAVQAMPTWTPAKKNGKPVAYKMVLPLRLEPPRETNKPEKTGMAMPGKSEMAELIAESQKLIDTSKVQIEASRKQLQASRKELVLAQAQLAESTHTFGVPAELHEDIACAKEEAEIAIKAALPELCEAMSQIREAMSQIKGELQERQAGQ